jgi:hypothetical protein
MRRRIALTIFFALGVAPTLAVAAWCFWWHSARHVAAEAEQLGWRLGMKVWLSGVRHPRPGVVVYEEIEAREPETNQPFFRCREVEVRWADGGGDSKGKTLQLVLSQPEINTLQWAEAWRLVDRVLTRRAEPGDVRLQITAEQVTLTGRGQSYKLAQAEGRVETLAGGPQASVTFRLAGNAASDRVRLLVTRNRQVTPPATGFTLDTAGTPLPCRMLALGLPGFDLLGPRSEFCGTLAAGPSSDGPSGELVGQFTEVNLERLVPDRSSHRLTGAADITVELARFSRGRLQEGAGSLVAGPGMVSRSLLEVAVQRLGMAGGAGIDRDDPLVPYEQLALWFSCDAKGLRVRGLSPGGGSGTILASRRGPILSEPQPSAQQLPLSVVVQALAPEAEDLVPIARQRDWLMRRLPIPETGGRGEHADPKPLRK